MVDCGPECEETLRQLEGFLDRELDPALRTKIESHLSGCGSCTDRAEFRQHLKELVQSKCAEQLPAGLRDRLAQLIGSPDASIQ
jgi:mycothiol system anti-sigma-R factor